MDEWQRRVCAWLCYWFWCLASITYTIVVRIYRGIEKYWYTTGITNHTRSTHTAMVMRLVSDSAAIASTTPPPPECVREVSTHYMDVAFSLPSSSQARARAQHAICYKLSCFRSCARYGVRGHPCVCVCLGVYVCLCVCVGNSCCCCCLCSIRRSSACVQLVSFSGRAIL